MPAETNTLKKEISETREDLGENINALEMKIRQNWDDVKKEFSPIYQTQQHPWLAVGISVAAGAAAVGMLGDSTKRPKVNFQFLNRFSDEIQMAKNMLVAAGLKKLASTVKENFPAAQEAVEKVMQSALLKVESSAPAGTNSKKYHH